MNHHIGPYCERTMKPLMGFRAVQEWSTCLVAEQTCLARVHWTVFWCNITISNALFINSTINGVPFQWSYHIR